MTAPGPADPAAIDVVVGRIGRPHGLRGEVGIDLRTDEPDLRFAPGATVHLARSLPGGSSAIRTERDLVVATSRWHSDRLLVSFEGVPDRTAAEGLTLGWLVSRVAVDETPDENDAWYDRQLVGLRVLLADGNDVGVVREVVHLPSQDLIEVALTAGGRRLVPFVAALVPEVDPVAGHLRLAPVDGLLEDLD